jgi:SnoaL-like polyketide cyclase
VTRPDPGADNKARARLIWAELLNARDLRLAPALFAPEFVNHNARPCTPKGPDGVAEVFIRLWAGSSDLHFSGRPREGGPAARRSISFHFTAR